MQKALEVYPTDRNKYFHGNLYEIEKILLLGSRHSDLQYYAGLSQLNPSRI